MNKILNIVLTVFICIGVLVFCGYYGYRYFSVPSNKVSPYENTERLNSGKIKADALDAVSEAADFQNLPDIEDEKKGEKIEPATKMVYEYYYTKDSTTQRAEEEPPYYMIGKTKEEMEAIFDEWEIVSFSKDAVVMRKSIDAGSAQSYIVGVQDGFVAVFYTEAMDGAKIKEVTDTPISALPKEDQKKLLEGISISGDDALIRLLEDYGS